MKRRSFAETAGTDDTLTAAPDAFEGGLGSASPSSEGREQKTKRTKVEERISPFDVQELPVKEKAARVLRHVDVPLNADQHLLKELFGPTAPLKAKLFYDHGCSIALGPPLAGAIRLLFIEGQALTSVEAAVTKIRSIFRMPSFAWSGQVAQLLAGGPLPQHLEGRKETRPETKHLDLASLDGGDRGERGKTSFSMPEDQAPYVMTLDTKEVINQVSGAEVVWEPPNVRVHGTETQRAKALKMLMRVTKHCYWGVSEAKVAALLQPRRVEDGSTRLKLTPMGGLKPFEAALAGTRWSVRIGKGKKENDLVVNDKLVSRQHCVLEFDRHRGGVYIYDLSTNGTFLNGRRLPAGKAGKILVMHGDELLLRNPEHGDAEFGYIINLQQVY